jgi:hypothetical protein
VAEAKREVSTLQADIATSERTIREARLKIANDAADASTDASKAISDQATEIKGLFDTGVEAGKVTVEAAEKARAAINQFAEAQQQAATAGAKFSDVGLNRTINELAQTSRTAAPTSRRSPRRSINPRRR